MLACQGGEHVQITDAQPARISSVDDVFPSVHHALLIATITLEYEAAASVWVKLESRHVRQRRGHGSPSRQGPAHDLSAEEVNPHSQESQTSSVGMQVMSPRILYRAPPW